MKTYETLIADIRTEACELADKLKRLEVFMMSEDFCTISPEQKDLLERQHDLMAQYKTVLIQRAHRINYEHVTFVQEPEKSTDDGADGKAPKEIEISEKHLCTACKYFSVSENGYSGCHHPHPNPCQRDECWELK